jgi:hypothetical protein
MIGHDFYSMVLMSMVLVWNSRVGPDFYRLFFTFMNISGF